MGAPDTSADAHDPGREMMELEDRDGFGCAVSAGLFLFGAFWLAVGVALGWALT